MKTKAFSLFVAIILLFVTGVVHAYEVKQSTTATHALLLDVETGSVLFEKNATEHMPTSSMSKVMTMYMVFEALKEGRLKLADKMHVSRKAWSKKGSSMFLKEGQSVTVEDLIRGVVIQSGNDATIVFAEGLAGEEDIFSEAMTQRAKDIGMQNSNFKNASGWPHPDHYSTAKDLAILSYRTLVDFPEYYKYYSEKSFKFNGIDQPNRNMLLFRNMGVDGLKTGHTQVGGYGMMTSANRGDRRLILVVNGLKSERARAQESARLLEWGFREFENIVLFEKGTIVDSAETWLGQEANVSLVIKEELKMTVPKNKREQMVIKVKYEGPIATPIQKGDEVAKLSVEIPNMPVQEFPLYAGENVGSMGFIPETMAKAKYFLFGSY